MAKKQRTEAAECIYFNHGTDICRCYEIPSFPTHNVCRDCGTQGTPLGVVEKSSSLALLGNPVGTPIVATLWTCPPCGSGTELPEQ